MLIYTRLNGTKKKIFVEVFSAVASFILNIQHFEFPNFHSACHHGGSLSRDVWLKKSYLLTIFSSLYILSSAKCVYANANMLMSRKKAFLLLK